MNEYHSLLARHNFAALCALSQALPESGSSDGAKQPLLDVAGMIHSLFDSIAWADRRLHVRESGLLEVMLEENNEIGAKIKDALDNQVQPEPLSGCLRVAASHDAKHGTSHADLLLNHLENLGRLIIIADGEVTVQEARAFREHFAALRKSLELSEAVPS